VVANCCPQARHIPRPPGTTQQFDAELLKALMSQYQAMMHFGLRIRHEIKENRTPEQVEGILRSYWPGIAPMLKLGDDGTSPRGVVPVVAEVHDYLLNERHPAYAVDVETVDADPFYAIAAGHLMVVFRDYRQYAPRQSLLALFLTVSQMTVLLANKHGVNTMVCSRVRSPCGCA